MSYPYIVAVGVLSFAISIFCSYIIYRTGHKLSLIDIPTERSSHLYPTPRGGGIGIWLSFIVTGIFFTHQTVFTIIAGIIGLIGFVDDRVALSAKVRLLFQTLLSVIAITLFSGLPQTATAALLFVLFIIFITGTSNFYNFMDGINGIAGLTGVVAFGLLSFFSFFIRKEPEIALMSISLASACLGFLPLNIPRAKVFMGNIGSIFLGFVFGSFVVKLSVDISVFLCLVMFLSMFYADAILTISVRWSRGENLMKAHRSHLYQYLSNELRLKHWIVSAIYAVVQFIVGLFALSAYGKGLIWQLGVFSIFSIIFLVSYKVIKRINPIAAETRVTR